MVEDQGLFLVNALVFLRGLLVRGLVVQRKLLRVVKIVHNVDIADDVFLFVVE